MTFKLPILTQLTVFSSGANFRQTGAQPFHKKLVKQQDSLLFLTDQIR